ncbi:MAG: MarR family transcriptional regulator [Rhodobacteraceae bacterium]|jgi:DNA-binding MarR family transcriptional regulator|nr:MarR family transcriptional regulator [Paracoccaceae bacterium]
MTDPDPYRLHASLGYQLSLAARLQERRLEEGLRALGLSRVTWCVLLAVGNEGLAQPSDIAVFVGVDRTVASRALRQMESAGLIARAAGSASGRGDRRTTTVRLTDLGQERLRQGTPLARANNAAMEARLTPDESEALRRLLARVRAGDDRPLPSF